MAQASQFWDKIAAKYAQQPIADHAAYQKKLTVTRDYLQPDMELLEIGCGTGSTAILHAPYVKHIHAIDFSANMIAIAQGKAEAEHIHNVTFEQASIENINSADQSLDAVLGLSILHLLKHQEAAITRVYQMLKPGGIFVTSTPCIGNTMSWFRLIGPIGQLLGFFPFIGIFTTQTLEDNLTNAGFELDYQWQPSKHKAVFMVAKKPGSTRPTN
ncbi:class I SAM-dependent methyltransferase [filamentous cyanobacterium LEGE 11480]|uniref:Class I SAM-dependent methyltransferase n=1 Tax=Romeriopsis navalis LEGE 11480 TaxID=2777977 RepID=A0A928VKH0_9CYAN|nr:class I SAM-dependent methyltransferase [Romeriopsis navalis]MBE9029307.1 class I SAM-dependent methyltransferase [Romeriopsis navalis LEGE 11480]